MGLSSFLRRLLGDQERSGVIPISSSALTPTTTAPEAVKPTEREIFKSPQLLADWVGRFFIGGRSLEDDYTLVPDADTRRDLEITAEQRDRCVREYTVVRVAGVSLFIKQHYPDEFWLAFMDYVLPHVLRHIQSTGHTVDRSETRGALEGYVEAASLGDPNKCASLYMSRLYDDNSKYIRMKLAGIGNIANDQIVSTYEIFRDAYCQATQGMSYDTYKALTNAIEKVSKGEA